MATISNVQLDVGRNSNNKEFARVRFRVTFSNYEVNIGVPYRCDIALLEIDSGRDQYSWSLDLSELRWRGGDVDDFIGWIKSFNISPTSQPQEFDFERAWNFPSNEAGNEEYEALVLLTPSQSSAFKWSNRISINLK